MFISPSPLSPLPSPPCLPPCCVQELVTYTHSCKKCLSVIERSHQSLQKTLDGSRTLQHMQTTLLQKRVADLQSSSQVQRATHPRVCVQNWTTRGL